MKKEIDIAKKPTQKQIEMLRNAAAYPVTEEDEYPELSEEELLEFHKISGEGLYFGIEQNIGKHSGKSKTD